MNKVAASTRLIPAGTSTSSPSSTIETVSVFLVEIICSDQLKRVFLSLLSFSLFQEIFAKLFDKTLGRPGSGFSKSTNRATLDLIGNA